MNRLFKAAFTLIELLVVIAIIGILSGLIVVTMSGVTQKANIAKAQVFSNSLRNALMLNLVSEWKLDGDVNDSWSSGNNGTNHGASPISSDCIYGSCYSFNGSGNYIDCGSNDNLNIANSITISFWFKSTAFDLTRGIISKMHYASGTDKQGYYIRFNPSGGLYFSTQNNALTNGTVSTLSALSLNRWYFIVEVFDSGTMKVYVDGALNNQTTGQNYPASTTYTFKIGSTYGGTEDFSGLIDEVRVYSSAIPSSLIKKQYYSGLNNLLVNGGITKEEYLSRINSYAINN